MRKTIMQTECIMLKNSMTGTLICVSKLLEPANCTVCPVTVKPKVFYSLHYTAVH